MQSLSNVGLGVFGVTDINLPESDTGMGFGKVTVEREELRSRYDTDQLSALGPADDC